jgi:hypothetical protein
MTEYIPLRMKYTDSGLASGIQELHPGEAIDVGYFGASVSSTHGGLSRLDENEHPQYVLSATNTLSVHTDVSSTISPAVGDVLVWNGSLWTASADGGSSGGAVSSLTDVSSGITPAVGDNLVWDGTEWTASADAGGAGATDHGALTGLSDDDHTQYLLQDGTRQAAQLISSGIINASGDITTNGNLSAVGNVSADLGNFTKVDITHDATGVDDHALEISANAGGFGDVKALDIVYETGALSAGEDEAILVNINDFLSTGGEVYGLEVLTTEGGAEVYGTKHGGEVNPILQGVGFFENLTAASANGTDSLSDFSNSAVATTLFSNDSDTATFGLSSIFEEIEIILSSVSSKNIEPTFEYSNGVGTWATFVPTDGTNGFRNTGVIAWQDEDTPGFVVGDGAGNYLVRITRTRNGAMTAPTLQLSKADSLTSFYWDKFGKISISAVDISDNLNVTGNIAVTGTHSGFNLSGLDDVSSAITPQTGDVLVWDGTEWTGGSSDHGGLTGLADDDHTQYLLVDGTRAASSLTVSGDVIAENLDISAIRFNIASGSLAYQEGQMYWDSEDHTIAVQTETSEVTLQVGQEVFVRATNKTGVTIDNGSLVYINGAQGNRPTIALATASGTVAEHTSIGITTQSIDNNNTGYVTTFGLVRGLDTSLFTEGDILYLDTTPGGITNVEPSGTNAVSKIGHAARIHATEGIIFADADIGPDHVRDLVDVTLGASSTGDILTLSSNNIWG